MASSRPLQGPAGQSSQALPAPTDPPLGYIPVQNQAYGDRRSRRANRAFGDAAQDVSRRLPRNEHRWLDADCASTKHAVPRSVAR
jgi:hypothetical protein